MAMVDKEKECACTCNCTDEIKWLQRRLDSVNEDYRKLRKMVRIVVAILVDKKFVGENVAKTFMESNVTRGDVDKLIEWLLENA